MRAQLDKDTGEGQITAQAGQVKAVLEDLLRNRTPLRISHERKLPEVTILAMREAYGWPSVPEVREAITYLEAVGPTYEVTFPLVTTKSVEPKPEPEQPTVPRPAPVLAPKPMAPPARQADTALAGIAADTATVDQLITAAIAHDTTAIRRAGEKLAALAERLRADLVTDARNAARLAEEAAAKEKLRAEIAATEERLAQLRAQLGGDAELGCVDCGRTFGSKQGLATHRTRSHK